MDKSFQSILNLNKDPKINSAGNLAVQHIPNLIFCQNFLLILVTTTLFRENKFGFLWVRCYDGNGQFFAHKLFQLPIYLLFITVRNPWIVLRFKLRSGQEPCHALPIYNKTTFVCVLNQHFNYRFVFDCFFGFCPNSCLPGFFQREFYVTVCVFWVYYLSGNNIADTSLFQDISCV